MHRQPLVRDMSKSIFTVMLEQGMPLATLTTMPVGHGDYLPNSHVSWDMNIACGSHEVLLRCSPILGHSI